MIFLNRAAVRFPSADLVARAIRTIRRFPWKKAARIAALAFAIALFGFLVGGMAVFFPPMFAIAAAAIPGLILLWTAPELHRVPTKLLKKVFFVVLFVEICIPTYYAIQLPGLPWISIRRVVVLFLIVLFAVSFSGSAELRRYVSNVLKLSKRLYFCLVGYYVVATLSILTSANPTESISLLSEWTLNWYVPALACVIVIRSMDDVRTLLKLISFLSLFVTALGVADFVAQRNYALAIMPGSLVSSLMASNPSFALLVGANPFRNGFYRAFSIFNVPLSYGEFVAMVAPLGAFFVVHGDNYRERLFGTIVVISVLASLFVSGARGGSIAFLVSMPVFVTLWIVRSSRINPRSMIGPLGGAFAFSGLLSLFGLIVAWGRLRVMIFGGGAEAYSDTSRIDQARLALPHILANPITGYGVGNAAEVIGYHSPGGGLTLDSSILDSSRRNRRSRIPVLFRRDRLRGLVDGDRLSRAQRPRFRHGRSARLQFHCLYDISTGVESARKPVASLHSFRHRLRLSGQARQTALASHIEVNGKSALFRIE